MAIRRYSDERDTLLRPTSLLPARAVLDDPALMPDRGGIYAWWFDEEIPSVPLDNTLTLGSHRLLYIGIAPRAPSADGAESKSTLRKRIVRNHLSRRIASSTLRRSLAWLLSHSLELAIGRNGARKAIMSRDDEERLTGWMCSHAAISLLCHEQAWTIEEDLIANGPALPLNLKGSKHPFRMQLSAMRAKATTTNL
ncbi:GIY-YIG nuclease family protein [Neoaquamicrobium sediminum]|uniref:GIY-YIG nuclease family protein n=1 Tax=Neoaquamicrobium sediminum TaxID=1849104 RepID=UPI003BAB1EB5